MSSPTNAPFALRDEAPVRTTWRTLFIIGAFLATGFGSWVMLKAQVTDLEKRTTINEIRSISDHEILLEMRSDLKALLRDKSRD